MDFTSGIVEAGATLRDPHFAFGFFVTAAVISAAAFCAGFFWRHQNRHLHRVSGIGTLIAVLCILGARGGITLLAAIALKATSDKNFIVHYWYTQPYVWSVWLLAAVAFGIGVLSRSRREPVGAEMETR